MREHVPVSGEGWLGHLPDLRQGGDSSTTINNLLEGKLMEQRTPDELKRELQLIQDDLQSVKLQQARLTKAAMHLGNAIQTLCKQELERFGCD
jgi:hypothetical protein